MARTPRKKTEKRNLSSTDEWRKCDNCSLYITCDSSILHSDDCSGTQSSITTDENSINSDLQYSFIKDGVLHTEITGVSKADVKFIGNLKNIAYLHPSTIKAIEVYKYIYIKSSSSSTLCVAYPLKSLKKSVILFPNLNIFKFKDGENVTVVPYNEAVRDAIEVTVSVSSSFKENDSLLLEKLYNRFLHIGMTLELAVFETICQFTILDIHELSQCENKNQKNVVSHSDSHIDLLNTDFESLQIGDHFPLTSTPVAPSRHKPNVLHEENSEVLPCSELPKFYVATFETFINQETSAQRIKQLKFDNIGGLNEQLLTITTYLKSFVANCNDSNLLYNFTFVGPSGTGKSLVIDAICNEYKIHTENINWYKILARKKGEVENELKESFSRAMENSPSVIIMEEYNYLCPRGEKNNQFIPSILSSLIEKLNNKVLIIASSCTSDYDVSILERHGRKIKEIIFPVPSIQQRTEILQKLLQPVKHNVSACEIQDLVKITPGFTGKNLAEAVNNAKKTHLTEAEESIGYSDMKIALSKIKPTVVSSDDVPTEKLYWKDIGGMQKIISKLKEVIELPLEHPKAFEHFNIAPSHGILMFGPPGCGKTMIAKIIATECNLNFIAKSCKDLCSKYVGESEKAVRNLFLRARSAAPCIIFFDEIDSLAEQRGGHTGDSGVGERIVTTLLQEMAGMEELKDVIILATTNRPDRIEKAFLRNGRIDHLIYIPLPDLDTREHILRLELRNKLICDDVDVKMLAQKTEGYSSAEVKNICKEAGLKVLAENMRVYKMHHFDAALQGVLPRTSKEIVQLCEHFHTEYGSLI